MPFLPNTQAAVYYAFTISVNGIAIGYLQGFDPSQSKEVQRVRQIMYETGNVALETVPGATEISITAERIEMYTANFFQAIGRNLVTLEEFNDPFDILEEKHTPSGSSQRIQYVSCSFSSYGRRIAVNEPFIRESVTIQVARIRSG